MNNKTTTHRRENGDENIENRIVTRKTRGNSTDEKNGDQFTELTIHTGNGILGEIIGNMGDYKVISEDQNLTSIEKALGKRKVMAVDIGLCYLTLTGVIAMTALGKKVFSTW